MALLDLANNVMTETHPIQILAKMIAILQPVEMVLHDLVSNVTMGIP
jgi:hypothetical protein